MAARIPLHSTAQRHPRSPTARARRPNDLDTWIAPAENQDQPRFDPTLEADETLAVNDGSALGNDLSTEDSDLQQDNSLALMSGILDNDEGVSNTNALSSDCAGYGVTLNWGS